MKHILVYPLLSLLAVSLPLSAQEKHDHADHAGHDHEHTEQQAAKTDDAHDHGHDHAEPLAGPAGGKVLMEVEPHVELLVREDRKIQLTPLDEKIQPTQLAGQSATAIAGSRSNPTRMSFVEENGALVSDNPLPEGDNQPIILRLTPAAEAEPVTIRLNLNLAKCPTCEYKEYACVCAHGEEDHAGHDHGEHEGHDH